MSNTLKIILISLTVALILAGSLFGINVATVNGAINREEQVKTATATLNAQEKRREDLIGNLVQVVMNYAEYENITLTGIATAQSSADAGLNLVDATSRAYPELKANANYQQLMTELSITENQIANYRENYNSQVREYNKYTRAIFTKWILEVNGYEFQVYTYTEYDASETAPSVVLNSWT